MTHAQAEPVRLPAAAAAPLGLELRHLRYFAAVAGAGTFTRAAEQMFIAQPTLSQQIRRLEELVGTPLLHRRRDGPEERLRILRQLGWCDHAFIVARWPSDRPASPTPGGVQAAATQPAGSRNVGRVLSRAGAGPPGTGHR